MSALFGLIPLRRQIWLEINIGNGGCLWCDADCGCDRVIAIQAKTARNSGRDRHPFTLDRAFTRTFAYALSIAISRNESLDRANSPTPEPIPSSQPTPKPQKITQPSTQSPSRIPGFPTGTSEAEVRATLGEPTSTMTGYWANTRSALYEVIPDSVTLAYIYDRTSNHVRQTEASFAPSMDELRMRVTVNGMLGSQAPADVMTGLQHVYQRQSNQYSFQQGSLKGVIERNNRDRIYVAVWDADLH